MIDYKILKENGFKPRSIKKRSNSYLLDTLDGRKYVIKKDCDNVSSKLDYLLSRNFGYFPSFLRVDDYNIFDYVEDFNISDEERFLDMASLTGVLHSKTMRYKDVDIDDYKIIYEDLEKEIDYLISYYTELNDLIDREIYMSPSKYLLVCNISKIYSALYFCKRELSKWYDLVKDNSKQRVSFIHNNLDLDHLIRNDNLYLISWDKSKVDMPIYDLYNLYTKYYKKTSFDIFLSEYQKVYPLSEDELKLFFIKISIPYKVSFDLDEFSNTSSVRDLLIYISHSDRLIKSYYKKANN